MANDKKKNESLRGEVDDDPTLEFEIPASLNQAGEMPAPEIELDENTYDIDQPTDPSANLSKSELKLTVRAQADRIGELEYELEQLTSRHRGLSEELKAREEIATTLNGEAARARDALRKAEATIRSRYKDHETLKSALDRTNERVSNLDRENKTLQEQLAESKQQADALKGQLDTQERIVRKLEADLQAARHTSETRTSSDKETNQRVAELQAQLDSAKSELSDLRNYVDQRKAEWDERDNELADVSTGRAPDERQDEEVAEQIAALKSELASARAQSQENRTRLKQQKQAAKALRRENRKLRRFLTHAAPGPDFDC